MKVEDSSWKPSSGVVNRIRTENCGSDGETYLEGTVIIPAGAVLCYSQGFRDSTGEIRSYFHSRMDFPYRGRVHSRNFSGIRYTSRGFVRKAKQFAADIIALERK